MIVQITAKCQITLPARVLEALGVQPGDRLELRESPQGLLLRPRRIDHTRLAPLRARLRKGKHTFNVESFRAERRDPTLRD